MSTATAVQVLIAEDDPGDYRLICEALSESNILCEIQLVRDGEQALQAVQNAGTSGNACPDILLLDIHLPRVDGLQVLRAFRANENCTQTPVLVLSTSIAPSDRVWAESFEHVHFVQKPVTFDEFLDIGQTVKRVLLRAHGA